MVSNILAIETSCDETSAAVLTDYKVMSNIIASQAFHTRFGGVVPELASRAHIKYIDIVADEALKKSGLSISDIGTVAATAGPGLIGSLLVGLNFAKSFAMSGKRSFIPVDHIESHLYSCFIGRSAVEFPFISLVVSGGHTILTLVKNYFDYILLGQTQDDAAGEAFDKVAKMLGLGYPGGPLIDELSRKGDDNFHEFPVSSIKDRIYDFSFSGIKTSVLYFLKKKYGYGLGEGVQTGIPVEDISASFQKAVIKALFSRTLLAAANFGIRNIAVSGGVSANSGLRSEFRKLEDKGYKIFFPDPEYSVDNAAMIGYTAHLKLRFGKLNAKSDEQRLLEPAYAMFDPGNFDIKIQ